MQIPAPVLVKIHHFHKMSFWMKSIYTLRTVFFLTKSNYGNTDIRIHKNKYNDSFGIFLEASEILVYQKKSKKKNSPECVFRFPLYDYAYEKVIY